MAEDTLPDVHTMFGVKFDEPLTVLRMAILRPRGLTFRCRFSDDRRTVFFKGPVKWSDRWWFGFFERKIGVRPVQVLRVGVCKEGEAMPIPLVDEPPAPE